MLSRKAVFLAILTLIAAGAAFSDGIGPSPSKLRKPDLHSKGEYAEQTSSRNAPSTAETRCQDSKATFDCRLETPWWKDFNFWIAVFTFAAAAGAICAALATKKSADVLAITQRAWLFEKQISAQLITPSAPAIYVKIEFWLKNSGLTSAIIISERFYWYIGKHAPNGKEVDAQNVSIPLSAGAEFKFSTQSGSHVDAHIPDLEKALFDGEMKYWFFGEIIYVDAMKKEHRSRFTYNLGYNLGSQDKLPSPPHTEYT